MPRLSRSILATALVGLAFTAGCSDSTGPTAPAAPALQADGGVRCVLIEGQWYCDPPHTSTASSQP